MQDESGSGGAVSEVSASAVPLIDFSFEEEEEVICLLNLYDTFGHYFLLPHQSLI